MKIAIVIPAHNEEKRIGKTLKEYSKFFRSKFIKEKLDYEILVVINKTSDKTEEIVKSFLIRDKKIKFINLKDGGKGLAVMEGFKNVLLKNATLIGFVDADMATSPKEYYRLIKEIKEYDGAIASRWIKGAVVNPRPSMRRMIARTIFNILIRALLMLPYRDTQCGAKIFRNEVIKLAVEEVSMSQWAFDVDLLYVCKKRGFRIVEVPTNWNDKEYSKINFWQAGPKMALGIIRLRLLNSPFRGIISAYDRAIKKSNVGKSN